jgi:hypothetical protein
MRAVPELAKTPKTRRTNERGKPLIPQRILVF